MAKILNNNNHLEDELNEMEKSLRKLQGKGLIILVLAIFSHFILPFIAPLTILFFLGGKTGKKTKELSENISIKKAGLKGEKQSLKIFEKLPNEYSVISDLQISVDGKTSQIDNVIVGPNGLFIVEVKNMNGSIYGKEDDHEITQEKVGRNGGEYSKSTYNPVKQVKTHVYRLSQLLKKNNIGAFVQGTVFFTNPEANVYIESQSIPVFSLKDDGDRDLVNYIQEYNRCNISKQQQIKIEQLLLGSIIK